MSEDDYKFDDTDVEALERKGLKIPTGDVSPCDDSGALPLPESLQDSESLAMRIIAEADRRG